MGKQRSSELPGAFRASSKEQFAVGMEGFEPSRHKGHKILNLACIPFHHTPRNGRISLRPGAVKLNDIGPNTMAVKPSRGRRSKPQLADYKSAALPLELPRHYSWFQALMACRGVGSVLPSCPQSLHFTNASTGVIRTLTETSSIVSACGVAPHSEQSEIVFAEYIILEEK